ncbi:cyclic peptide export ABC transporter [Idiomarina xiamenensis]|uniref:Cyclic peptide transporter n=1 Tax=Idiomarina xiamenensis 10-D-4 TaxID=740709 RepID=K2JZH3_9GAMM|nr:cyclic peptide export ABC transporter [Idiomarina xiamenensis]EKE80858.1 cyclic peptide transporter [Idiomarina xiamenensis 10-D-4]
MKLLGFLFRYSPKFIILAAFFGVIGGLASTAVLAIINEHLKDVNEHQDLLIFFGLCMAILIANIAARACIAGLSQWSAFDLRLQLGRRWVDKPLSQLEGEGSSRYMAAITNDVDRLSVSMQIMPSMCIDITVILSCMVYLGYLSWVMLLIMIAFIALAIFTRHIPQKKCDSLLIEAHRHGEEIVGTYNAIRGGIKELKMNRKRWNDFYAGELYEISGKLRDKRFRAELVFGLIRGYSEVIYFLFVGLLIFGGGVTGELSQEVVVGFAVTLLFMKTNIDHVQEHVGQIARAQASLNNLISLGVISQTTSLTLSDLRLRSDKEKLKKNLALDAKLQENLPTALKKEIRFENVEYQYGESEKVEDETAFKLHPINLSIRTGELVFIIGGNGSGKTSFAKVLCGLYTPTKGKIYVDDVEITEENRNWYSQYFGSIFSDSYLFDKLYGSEGLPEHDAEVEEHLKELRLDKKVQISKGQFSTTALSQGQRKRLALVTAYVENRPLYLFDEWAADQDPEFREVFYHKILPSLKQKGKTVIVISHDDRYYDIADRLIKFEGGKIVGNTDQKKEEDNTSHGTAQTDGHEYV